MQSIQGFLLINIYSLLMIIITSIIFFRKDRKKQIEDETYAKLLIITILVSVSGIFLGLMVNPDINVNKLLVMISNKLYLIFLSLWIIILTFYTLNVSFGDKLKADITNKFFVVFNIFNLIMILLLPLETTISNNGTVATGLSVLYTYIIFGLGFLFQIICIIIDRKHISSKKYIPIYMLALFGIIVLIIQIFFPALNYLINPTLVLITYIMFHTIENPDVKMLNTVILARDEAQRANRAKSDFLSSMSHEIRTPLNAIVGLSENMTLYKEQIPKELSEDVDDILSSSRTLLEIVGNVLDINKIESDKMEIISVPYNIREELYKVIRVSKTKLGNKPIKFNLNIDENIPDELIGDKVHIKEIINNLLTNAFKYTEQGEVKLELKCNNQDDKCNLVITVSDTGRGIKEENINKLFNKFERLDAPINSVVEGTGLGLAITKSLVEMMNGNISVESEFGKGSTFIVEIPQQINNVSQNKVIETINNEEESSNKKIKVLIVDDNKLNVKVARIALKEISDDIDECYDGLECIEKVKNNTYDLILMDIMMPNMDGEEALLKLKENKEFNTPVIVVTADASIESQEKYISEGFSEYLSKPFTKEQLKEKIDIVFNRK